MVFVMDDGFNPFFIRASVYWASSMTSWAQATLMFQSLLHQGISLLGLLEEKDHRIPLMFQSLLHQGISLLRAR